MQIGCEIQTDLHFNYTKRKFKAKATYYAVPFPYTVFKEPHEKGYVKGVRNWLESSNNVEGQEHIPIEIAILAASLFYRYTEQKEVKPVYWE